VDKFETKKQTDKGLGRRPYFPLDALYFVRNTRANLERILNDYEAPYVPVGEDCFERVCPCVFRGIKVEVPDPQYGDCRLLLVAARADVGAAPRWQEAHEFLESSLTAQPRWARLGEYWQRDSPLPDCLVDFHSLDTACFSLEMPDVLATLYARRLAGTPSRATQQEVYDLLDAVAYRLMHVCVALNEQPYVRFSEPLDDAGAPLGSGTRACWRASWRRTWLSTRRSTLSGNPRAATTETARAAGARPGGAGGARASWRRSRRKTCLRAARARTRRSPRR
jgi:hypothetical protein